MPDREKVIKGLETCYCPPSKCEDCPYHDLPDEQSCNDVLCLDALALLKEQKPVEPFKEGFEDYNCGSCGAGLRYEKDLYCPYCGKEIKWDETD